MSFWGPPNIDLFIQLNWIKRLMKALNYRKDQQIRYKAAEALGRIKDPVAVESLSFALQDEEWEVRRQAAIALGEIKDPRAVIPLICCLEDKIEYVRNEVVEALGKIEDKSSVDGLLRAFAGKDHSLRARIALALARIRDERSVQPLLEFLRDPNQQDFVNIAVALWDWGEKKVKDDLIRILQNDSWFRRKAAALSLEKIGWLPENDQDKTDYYLALQSPSGLAQMGSSAVPRLIGLLLSKDRFIHQEALRAILDLGQVSVKLLIEAIKSENRPIKNHSWKILERIPWQPQDGEEEAYKLILNKQWTELTNLGQIAVSPLMQLFSQEDIETQERALSVFGQIGDLEAAEIVISWLFEVGAIRHLSSTFQEESLWNGEFKNLFGDLTGPILKASVGIHRNTTSGQSLEGTYWARYEYDLSDCLEAVDQLCGIKSPITNNILHKIINRKDIEVPSFRQSIADDWDYVYELLSFESQRRRAVNEIRNRGNPAYNPGAYLKRELWCDKRFKEK